MKDTEAILNNMILRLDDNSFQNELKTWNWNKNKIEDDYEKELDRLIKLNKELQETLQKLNANNEELENKYHTEVQTDKIMSLEKEKKLEIEKGEELLNKLDQITKENDKIKNELTSLEQQNNTNNQTEVEEMKIAFYLRLGINIPMDSNKEIITSKLWCN